MNRCAGLSGTMLVVGLLASAGAAQGHADRRDAEPVKLTDASFLEIDAMVMAAQGRPNEQHRLRGLKDYRQGGYEDAREQFELAAYHADKYSQHYLSLMSWHGVGVTEDRVVAYIWADLAAERGSRRLLAIREKMWGQLTVEQQQQVEASGHAYYARYGDDVAKPRAERRMRAFARNMTGSRVGYRNQMVEIAGRPINGVFMTEMGANAAAYVLAEAVTPDELYGKEGGLARLDKYWQEQDRQLDGTVEVGPVKPVR